MKTKTYLVTYLHEDEELLSIRELTEDQHDRLEAKMHKRPSIFNSQKVKIISIDEIIE